jgi:hypothetical protein
MAYGLWLMAYGLWLMAYGLWLMAYGWYTQDCVSPEGENRVCGEEKTKKIKKNVFFSCFSVKKML